MRNQKEYPWPWPYSVILILIMTSVFFGLFQMWCMDKPVSEVIINHKPFKIIASY
jgi:hypothetical protein